MTTYSRLDAVLSDTDAYPLRTEHSYKNEVIKMDWLYRLFSPHCLKCRRKMTHLAVGVETDNFARVSRITQWHGCVCVDCGIVEDNNGDIN